ncbi:MAG: type II secretion system protein GspG [Candidatus Woesebacteria bacterium]|jgi:general secretion pathway protein G
MPNFSKILSKKTSRLGFTLIELVVVVGIIAFLAAFALVTFSNSGKKSRDSKRRVDLQTVRQALVMYRADAGTYPVVTCNSGLSACLLNYSAGGYSMSSYISEPVIDDPKNNAPYFYTYTSADGSAFTLDCTFEVDPTVSCTVTNP